MQKKIIALAVAGLVSGAAFAQSNVEIYGSMDMGYLWQGDNKVSGVDDRSGIDSGIGKANRLGFKGTEDLGNGLKASFTYEVGLNGGDGKDFMAATQNRQSFLALSGNFGTVAVGRQYTPQHLFYGAVDPFYNDNIGQVGNAIIKDVRLDNLAAYVSPELFGGLTLIAGYTMSYGGNESAGNESASATLSEANLVQDASVYALAAKYAAGPIFAAINYHAASTNNANSALDGIDVTVWDVMGTYDFGIVKLHGSYGSRDTDGVANTDQWMLGLSAPLGNGRAMFSYVDRNSDFDGTNLSAEVSQWAIGYDYNISKRTVAYVQYASQDQNDTAQAITGTANGGLLGYGSSVATSTSGTGNNYQQGFSLGVKHSF
jgi:predicted porin